MGWQYYMRVVTLAFLLSIQTGCGHLTSRTERLLTIGTGFSIGATIGASRPDEKFKNALMYGGLIGVLSAVSAEALIDDAPKIEQLRKETIVLKEANEALKLKNQPRLEQQGASLMNSPLPKDTRHLIKPGEWKRYKLDRWVQDESNENLWYRQTEMFEVIPPSLGSD